MTVWAWLVGIIGTVTGAWIGASVLDSGALAAFLGVGVALVWFGAYWFILDKARIPELSLGASVLLIFTTTPICLVLILVLGIGEEHRLWFIISVLAALQIYGSPTSRFRLDRSPLKDEEPD